MACPSRSDKENPRAQIIVFLLHHVHVRLNQSNEVHIADVYTFRNGKAIHFRTFADQCEASLHRVGHSWPVF